VIRLQLGRLDGLTMIAVAWAVCAGGHWRGGGGAHVGRRGAMTGCGTGPRFSPSSWPRWP